MLKNILAWIFKTSTGEGRGRGVDGNAPADREARRRLGLALNRGLKVVSATIERGRRT